MSVRIEILISKKDRTSYNAMEILNMILTWLLNETTGEEGYINEYDDNSGQIAVLMNLAKDILKIVPMKDMGWKNDGQGDRPKEFDEWVRELAEGLLKLITALIAAIGDFIAALVKVVVEVMALIEAIVKAAILAFIWAIFASVLALVNVILGIAASLNYTLSSFMDLTMTTNTNKIIVKGNVEMTFGYDTGEEYYNYPDLNVPTIEAYFNSDNIVFGFILSVFSMNFVFTKFLNIFISLIVMINCCFIMAIFYPGRYSWHYMKRIS
ncbi:MAG: hypothetical protein ACTSPD_12615 [Promethearchaeota archaeon]